MTTFLVSIVAGRLAAVLCPCAILLPYLLRRNRLSRMLGLAQEHAVPYLHRLWPHIWLAYFILGLSMIHAGTVMAAMSRANQAGVWAATVALFLIMLEVMLGLSLKTIRLRERTSVRRFHFWTMTGIVGSLAAHLWLNVR
jgi:hypothetical protein